MFSEKPHEILDDASTRDFEIEGPPRPSHFEKPLLLARDRFIDGDFPFSSDPICYEAKYIRLRFDSFNFVGRHRYTLS